MAAQTPNEAPAEIRDEAVTVATPAGETRPVISGEGSRISPDFRLPSGRYKVTVEWKNGCCVEAKLWTRQPVPEDLFYEYTFEGDGGRAEKICMVSGGMAGTVFLEVSTTEPGTQWSISFEPR